MSESKNSAVLQTRLTPAEKRKIEKAAKLRRVAISEYVRYCLLQSAEREISGAKHNVIELSPEDQLAFWNALSAPVKLTAAQKRLGKLMRGEA